MACTLLAQSFLPGNVPFAYWSLLGGGRGAVDPWGQFAFLVSLSPQYSEHQWGL